MADLKISELTNLTAADPANDMIPIVDVSATPPASGSTKRISINNILACSPSATLASATITGDLTVDTNTLKVDSANDRVGIGLAAGINAKLHVSSTGSVHINQRTGNNGCFTQYMDPTSSNYVGTDSGNFRVANNSGQDLLNIQQLGVFTFGDGAGGTRMTLNSSGLDIANGNVILGTSGKGIDFSATASGSGTMTSELLSDYEEGTWTPNIAGTTPTYTTQTGRYTKIGNRVFVTLRLTINNAGDGEDYRISGLPFANNSAVIASISVGYFANLKSAAAFLSGYINANASQIVLTATTGSALTVTNGFGGIGNSTDLAISAVYFV